MIRFILILFLSAFLSACKVSLYTNLDEQEGNEMLALLLEANIDGEKTPGADGKINLMIEEKQLAEAVQLLKRNGYPRDQFVSLGDIFSADSLVSSPLQERARYIYALSQDISETISQIEGVLVARVHVVLGERDRSGKEIKSPSASVFIKHAQGLQTGSLTPKIKDIVSSGIENLQYDHVTVAYFPTALDDDRKDWAKENIESVLFIDLAPESQATFYILFLSLASLLLLSLVVNGFLFVRLKKCSTQDDVAHSQNQDGSQNSTATEKETLPPTTSA